MSKIKVLASKISEDDGSNATLNVMQAIMALAVLTSHWGTHYGHQYVAQVKLPVDYFFFIEGFLAMKRLTQEASASPLLGTMVRRIWRIYPLHIFGLLLGAAVFFAAAEAAEDGWSVNFLGMSFGLGLLLQPTFSAVNEGAVFPLNPPSWAIVIELWAFAALFLCRFRLSLRFTALVFSVAAPVLLGCILIAHDNNMGWRTLNYWGGFPRVVFGFFGGAFLFRLTQAGIFKLPHLHPLLIWGLVLASLMIPFQYAPVQLLLLFAIPFVVLLGGASSKPAWLSACGHTAERHAYGIYLLCYPALVASREIGRVFGIPAGAMASFAGYVAALAFILLIVCLVVRYLDEPVRELGEHKFSNAAAAPN